MDNSLRMSIEESIESKAQALHTHIFSQPQAQYTNNPWALVNAIEEFAISNKMMTYRDGKIRATKAQLERMPRAPRTLLEFGTYIGNSAIAWGAILRDLNPGAESPSVYTFELSAVNAGIARDFIRLAGLQDIVHVVEGESSESLRALHAEGKLTPGNVDVVFFDHWEKFYVPDLKIVEELGLLRTGGLAVADNTDFPGAPEYVEYVQGSKRYRTDVIDLEELKPMPVSFSFLLLWTVFSLIIINKAGGLVYQREFQPGLRKLSTNDYLVLAGTFHGVHAITRSITPRIPISSTLPPTAATVSSSPSTVISPSGTSTPTTSTTPSATAHSFPIPGVPVTGLETLETEKFRLTCFQTLTGTKFLLFTDPMMGNIDSVMVKIYELYADYVMKNPFYQLEMPVRCEAFDRHLGGWLRGRT
ncbi:Sybindin-domain-containing protein [Aspergillus affinis]|uniref:Sybindin-domain-containing protein n=1 Tax=Aspergillus affinis TaxID=1070780 RepID=UPI0022FE777B|nr:Sybindin-domain-containing protein [Aspergillus affinis]KAI9037462.1 Sybindin-domain-containing protein [Aspergillus affinis]